MRGAKPLPIASIADLQEAGAELARSGMLGYKLNPSQGFVIAAICQQTGMSYNEYQETYHIVKGTPSMRTDTMLANLVELGGEYKILARDESTASIWMKHGAAERTFTLTAEEMFKEPTPYSSGINALNKPMVERTIKEKYATPRSLMQMLWARCVSDAVRTVCPSANKGQYTPEEVEDFEPQQTAPPRQAEPQPLQTLPEQPAVPPEICPIPGKLQGQAWADMDAPTLQYAANYEDSHLTPAHKEAIAKALQEKQTNE